MIGGFGGAGTESFVVEDLRGFGSLLNHGLVETGVCSSDITAWRCEEHFFFFLLDARFFADELDPLFCVAFRCGF